MTPGEIRTAQFGPLARQELELLGTALRQCERAREVAEEALADTRLALLQARQALDDSVLREFQARRDPSSDALTGLANRRSFQLRLQDALAGHAAQGWGLCLMFIDLDGFKAVNDQLGHAVGDALLKVVGARLMHAMRAADLVSRHGGDEFVCLLPQMRRPVDALAIAHKLVATVAAPCQLNGLAVSVQASIGVAMFPSDGLTAEALLDRADRAMLMAKQQRAGAVLARRLSLNLPPPDEQRTASLFTGSAQPAQPPQAPQAPQSPQVPQQSQQSQQSHQPRRSLHAHQSFQSQ